MYTTQQKQKLSSAITQMQEWLTQASQALAADDDQKITDILMLTSQEELPPAYEAFLDAVSEMDATVEEAEIEEMQT